MTRAEQVRHRLLGFRPTDTFWGWLWPIVIAGVGGLLRFQALGSPHQLVFDETYYVKQASSLIDYGVEMRVPSTLKSPDALFSNGVTNVWDTTSGDLVVHPPVGKWVIALGELLFGQGSSFGWRFSVALLGTLSILMIGRLARRMFGSTLMGAIAAFLLAFEGHHFVLTRTGILDSIVMFFGFAAFGALLLDRDRTRRVLATKTSRLPDGIRPSWTMWLGSRPWRWIAGISLGLCIGTKWSGLYFLAVFGIMTVWWDLGARRAAGVRNWLRSTALVDGPYAFLTLVPTAAVVYLTSWFGWFRNPNGYDRQWAAIHPGEGIGWLPPALRSLWQYETEVWNFNIGLTSSHPYEENPWGWTVQARPTSFFYEGPTKGVEGCHVEVCSKAITSIGTLPTWWLGTIAIVFVAYHWLIRRDWRAGAIMAGLIAGWLPWFQYQHRTIFGFYAVAFEPYLILGATFVLGLILGSPTASLARRRRGLKIVLGFLLLSLAVFAFFWPIYTAQVIPQGHWQWRMWFPSWV
ncbi:MAG: dolichyl-phosphate-mannose--protein mannosyltransferase [Nostocoides sp.]